MCHGAAVGAFPATYDARPFASEVEGFALGESGGRRIAIVPDIYGCSDLYFGLAAHLVSTGADVFIVNQFAGLGDLPEMTREKAFERRNKLQDKEFVDRLEQFLAREAIDGLIGFCLGGLYVFELARRGIKIDLLGLYGFPQGLPNSDPLPVPFDYLAQVTQPFTMLLGADDASVGPANIVQLQALAGSCPAMTLKVYEGVGHNFLPLLDSADEAERAIALDALRHIESVAA